jgi:hypothetical protein
MAIIVPANPAPIIATCFCAALFMVIPLEKEHLGFEMPGIILTKPLFILFFGINEVYKL